MSFKFGLETEYILLNSRHEALWHPQLDFSRLYQLIEAIDLSGIPSLTGLDPELAHDKILPYVVEGYHIKNEQGQAYSMWPKGLEIRTPVCQSLEQVMEVHEVLLERLKQALLPHYQLLSLSHHPWASKFEGPQAGRKFEFWQWAMKVMTTYGPDINISFPAPIGQKLFADKIDFEAKINYYAPALTTLTYSSPFYQNQLFAPDGLEVQSLRTLIRSPFAPMIEWHENEGGRIEFKFFEMAKDPREYYEYFLLCLILALSPDLVGRCDDDQRIRDCIRFSSLGPNDLEVKERCKEVLSQQHCLVDYFPDVTISLLRERLEKKLNPATGMIESFKAGLSLVQIIQNRTV